MQPQIRQDYPLNLSILISGGKETNKDSLSSGERSGKSPFLESERSCGVGHLGMSMILMGKFPGKEPCRG